MTLQRILVVKLSDFGDALLSTPALRLLRAAHPAARIDALTSPHAAVAFRHSHLVDEIIPFDKSPWDSPATAWRQPLALLRLARDLRAQDYDAVLILHNLVTTFGALKHAALAIATGAPIRAGLRPTGRVRWRGAFLTHQAVDPGYGHAHVADMLRAVVETLSPPELAASTSKALTFVPGDDAERAAAELLREHDLLPEQRIGPLVLVHPGSGPFSMARRWSAGSFAAVADGLIGRGAVPVLFGTVEDGVAAVANEMRNPVVSFAGRTDLPTLAALLAQADLMVGNDSGVMHLATAVGTPTVAIFGPSNDRSWGPYAPTGGEDDLGGQHTVVALDLPCRPCLYVGHRLGSPDGCATRDCLRWLRPDVVLGAAMAALEAHSRVPATHALERFVDST